MASPKAKNDERIITSMRLRKKLLKAVDAEAARQHRSRANLIEHLLETGLNRAVRTIERTEYVGVLG